MAVCWSGTLTDVEQRLTQPLPYYALEQLRARFMYAVTTNHDATKSARAAAQMAFETEIGAVISKIVSVSSDVPASLVCERRRYLDIDTDMQKFFFLRGPALNDMRNEAVLPDSYIALFETHLASNYPQYRMCATAALLLVSAQVVHG